MTLARQWVSADALASLFWGQSVMQVQERQSSAVGSLPVAVSFAVCVSANTEFRKLR